jgi:hypothetical protein
MTATSTLVPHVRDALPAELFPQIKELQLVLGEQKYEFGGYCPNFYPYLY